MEGSLAGDPVTGITAGTAQGHCIAGDRLVFKAVCGQQFKRLGVLAGQSQVYIFHGQRFGDCDAVKAAEIDQLYQIFVPADAVDAPCPEDRKRYPCDLHSPGHNKECLPSRADKGFFHP